MVAAKADALQTQFPEYVFNGDRAAAARQIPLAQNLLHKLRAFVKNSGTQVYSMSVNFNGGHIQATTNAGIERVYIVAGSTSAQSQEFYEEPDILSGVVKEGDIVTITPPIVGSSPFKTLRSYKPTKQAYDYPLKKKPGNYPATVTLPSTTFEDQPRLAVPAFSPILSLDAINKPNWLFCGNKSSANALIAPITNAISQLNSEVVTLGIAGTRIKVLNGIGYYAILTSYFEQNISPVGTRESVFIYADGEPETDASISQHQEITASQYSGYMAKCVQILLGLGKLKNPKASEEHRTKGVQIKYDWRWARCHGIVKGADGAFWLVEISILNGIIAMPLPLFQNSIAGTIIYSRMGASKQNILKETARVFNGIPSGATFPPRVVPPSVLLENPNTKNLEQALAAGDVIQLATVAQMQPYFEKLPFSTEMGWSFNEGSSSIASEAHNTCYKLGIYPIPVGDDYGNNVYHYKIAFIIGAVVKKRLQNQPVASGSATLSLVGNGSLVGSLDFEDRGYSPDFVRSATANLQSVPGINPIYTPKPTVLVAFRNNVLHSIKAEYISSIVIPPYTNSSLSGISQYINSFGQVISTDPDNYPVVSGNYTNSQGNAYRFINCCRSSICAELPNTTITGSSNGSGSYVTRTASDGKVTLGSLFSQTTNTYPEQVIRWPSKARDAYIIATSYTITRNITSQFQWVPNDNYFFLGHYENTQTTQFLYSAQPSMKIIFGKSEIYSLPEIPNISPSTADYAYQLIREIGRFKHSAFGSALNFAYDDYTQYKLHPAAVQTLINKTVVSGDLLAAESNATKVNYSFLGYV